NSANSRPDVIDQTKPIDRLQFTPRGRAPRAKAVPELTGGVLSLAYTNFIVTSPRLVATPGALALAREVLQIEAQAVEALSDPPPPGLFLRYRPLLLVPPHC